MIMFKVVVSKEVVTVSRPASSTVADLKADISAQTGERQQLPSLLVIAMFQAGSIHARTGRGSHLAPGYGALQLGRCLPGCPAPVLLPLTYPFRHTAREPEAAVQAAAEGRADSAGTCARLAPR